MAGGKETPRQKMIGMMYLVLTALLALQVSNSVLDRFVTINGVLETSNNENIQNNVDLLTKIEKQIEKRGNRPEDQAILKLAKEVRVETDRVFNEIENLKGSLVTETGGKDENGAYKGIKNEDVIANMMINKGGGEELQKLLNGYVDFLNKEDTSRQSVGGYKKFALDGFDDPLYKDNEDQRSKNYAELYFQSTPMVAGLATLSQNQSRILTYETEALNDLAELVGAKEVSFDELSIVVLPQSKIVAAGAKYEAEMFVGATSKSQNPEMFFGERQLEVAEGRGKLSFTASGGNYNEEGLIKKTFHAKIRIPSNDKVIEQDIEYFVAKPVIQVQSASVQALYLNCGNELNVQVPALGNEYKPSFTADGATTIDGSGGKVTVVPNKASVSLTVSSGGNTIGTEKFSVRRIPKPTIEVKSRNKVVDEKRGVSAPGPRSLDIAAIPDESFKQFLPKDARYKVTRWEVTLARGSRPVETKKVTSQKVNLTSFASKARPGDRIVIEVKEVKRLNFQNKEETVNVGTVIKTIPLN